MEKFFWKKGGFILFAPMPITGLHGQRRPDCFLLSELSFEITICLKNIQDQRQQTNPALSHHHVEHHHKHEADGKADGAEIRVLAARGLGNEFFYHHIKHGSGGKGEQIRENGH